MKKEAAGEQKRNRGTENVEKDAQNRKKEDQNVEKDAQGREKNVSNRGRQRTGRIGRLKSLKERLLFFIIVCWFVPVAVFGVFILLSYRKAYIEKTEQLIQHGIVNTAALVTSRLDTDIRESQKPSYERSWESAWQMMKKGNISAKEYGIYISQSLRSKYYLDAYDLYAFYLEEEKKPACYSSKAGYGYSSYLDFVEPEALQVMAEGDSYVQIRVIQNRVYLIRNLFTVSDYKKYGTLVIGLNTDRLVEGIPMEQKENVRLYIGSPQRELARKVDNGREVPESVYEDMRELYDPEANDKLVSYRKEGFNAYIYQIKKAFYHMAVVYAVDSKDAYESIYELYKLVMVMFSVFLPVLFYIIYFIRVQIEQPVQNLTKAFRNIRNGDLGMLMDEEYAPNWEFEYLSESFNSMSRQVKYLFDTVYNEKLARRDAQIAALQAQINPHFLNNTLEMMNWQARMNNDTTLSKMIEALGTVLDHSINRDNEKVVYLSEELRCADAYLYIMSMRFGQRLTVEREIDENLLRIKVPQLILQPLLENAIMHGVERVKSGIIRLKIHMDEDKICLDVINTGSELTGEKLKKIRSILAGDALIPRGQGEHTSIGIRNVNQRIKLVYGEKYGLEADSLDGGEIRFRIVLPCKEEL